MAIKAKYSKAKGLVQTGVDSIDKFEIVDAPLFPATQTAIEGNTEIALTVGSFHPADDAAPNAVNETDLDAKFFTLRAVDGTQFTIHFDIGAGDPAYAGPSGTAEANRIEVALAAAAADTTAKIAAAIKTQVDLNATFAAHFTTTVADPVVTFVNKKVGAPSSGVDSSDLVGVRDLVGVDAEGAATTYTWTAALTEGKGSYTLDVGGVTRTSSTAAGSEILLPDADSDFAGGEKIVICDGVDGGNTLVKSSGGATLATLNAAAEWVVFNWSGTAWVKVHAASGV